jgi:uncharacterized damage-inducible protein DinB
MDPAGIQAMFHFNTWANDSVREGLLSADEQLLRAPVEGVWFGSIFYILTHILGAETLLLARVRDGAQSVRLPAVDDFASAEGLADAWRKKDEEWENWVATLTQAQLDEQITLPRRDGSSWRYQRWQPIVQIPFHSTEHRGHATVVMTQLGIKHGPQDFIQQFQTRA